MDAISQETSPDGKFDTVGERSFLYSMLSLIAFLLFVVFKARSPFSASVVLENNKSNGFISEIVRSLPCSPPMNEQIKPNCTPLNAT